MKEYWGYLISAALGFIFGFVPLIVFERYKEFTIRKRIALAISSEIDTLFNLAQRTRITEFINRPFQRDAFYNVQVNFNYFTIYENNAHLISLLGERLTKQLIEFYSYTKQILDHLNLYQEILRRPDTDSELRDILERMRINLETVNNLRTEINIQIENIQREKFLYVFN